MSTQVSYLHSHSGLEKTLKDKDIANKSHVLVDERFKNLFSDIAMSVTPFEHGGVKYIKVPILAFVHKGGVFKNMSF